MNAMPPRCAQILLFRALCQSPCQSHLSRAHFFFCRERQASSHLQRVKYKRAFIFRYDSTH